ncbi:ABC transporter ATP-binding protein [Kineococcus sp. SYSU DK006]|uniref:ABC transporter ATP-binding protein n=1 Tax=Kineococcus sp. SYSU DK006 TaxID=3383127 RepID=UPI003D7C779E
MITSPHRDDEHRPRRPRQRVPEPGTPTATGTAGTAAAVAVRDLTVHRGGRRRGRDVLREVTAHFPPGTFTAVVGPSGSGKSTLLHCAAGLERPTRGSVRWSGREITGLGERHLARLRSEEAGFVFQGGDLLPSLTVAQNVELPERLAGRRPSAASVREALSRVGLADLAHRRPAELSGGQQQRAAVARALFTRPRVVFADEPTSALDRHTADEVLRLFRRAVSEEGRTVVLVTHDPVAASTADRVLLLEGGRLRAELHHPSAEQVLACTAGARAAAQVHARARR